MSKCTFPCQGTILAKILPLFKMGLGGRVGTKFERHNFYDFILNLTYC